jgi:hypothetical protein
MGMLMVAALSFGEIANIIISLSVLMLILVRK